MASESCRYLVLDAEEPLNFCIGTKDHRGMRWTSLENLEFPKYLDLDYLDWTLPPVFLMPINLLTFNTETEN